MVIPKDLEASKVSNDRVNQEQKRTIEELVEENAQLKHTIDLLSKRVLELERTQQENTMLKSSIIQFQKDIQRQVWIFLCSVH